MMLAANATLRNIGVLQLSSYLFVGAVAVSSGFPTVRQVLAGADRSFHHGWWRWERGQLLRH